MSIVREALIEEINELSDLSQDYYNIIQTAKTAIKKRTYRKKLSTHNNKLADLLISLDKLDKSKYNSQDTNYGDEENASNITTEQN